jgi:hypothetical protein
MKIKLILGIVISCIFLVWAFWDVNFTAFGEALASAHYLLFVLAMVASMGVFFLRAFRWKYLLILQKNIPYLTVFSATCIGFFTNNVLPFRAGELLRAYVIGNRAEISKSSALATIVVERILDVLSLILIAISVVFFLPVPDNAHFQTIKYFGILLILVEGAVIAFCFMLLVWREFTLRLVDKVFTIFPKRAQSGSKKVINSFIDGLEILRSFRHLLLLFISSFIIWFAVFLQIYIVMRAFDIQMGFTTMFTAGLVDLVLISFALTIPSAPGFIGTYHAAAKEGLLIFSINPVTAAGFSVLIHASSYIPITIVGFFYFIRENIHFSTAKAVLRQSETDPPSISTSGGSSSGTTGGKEEPK